MEGVDPVVEGCSFPPEPPAVTAAPVWGVLSTPLEAQIS